MEQSVWGISLKSQCYLQLLMDLLWKFLVVRLQQLNGLLQGLKHFVSGGLSVFDSKQVTHAFHQTIVIPFLHRLHQTRVSGLDKLCQLLQTVKYNLNVRHLFIMIEQD